MADSLTSEGTASQLNRAEAQAVAAGSAPTSSPAFTTERREPALLKISPKKNRKLSFHLEQLPHNSTSGLPSPELAEGGWGEEKCCQQQHTRGST